VATTALGNTVSHSTSTGRTSGFTVAEVITVLVALVVIGAVAIPMWRTHELRVRRQDAIEALLAIQAAQDQYFGEHASYADQAQLIASPPEGLGIRSAPKLNSKLGFYEISVRNSADDLSYWATARLRSLDEESLDTRCVELRIDQNGRRFATDSKGEDRSADCWH